jgi:hypothetical protein
MMWCPSIPAAREQHLHLERGHSRRARTGPAAGITIPDPREADASANSTTRKPLLHFTQTLRLTKPRLVILAAVRAVDERRG